MPAWLQIISLILSIIISATTVLALLCKPFRKILLNKQHEEQLIEDRKETDKCLLRNSITTIYYKYQKDAEMPQYEYENVERLYKQYKKLGGNSFVDKIWNEIQEWRIFQ